MADIRFTVEQLQKLKAAYASGVLRYRYGETEVTYQSMAEMRKAIADMERQLGCRSKNIVLSAMKYESGL